MERAIPSAAGQSVQTRTIDVGDLRWALAEGWKDFQAKRGDLLFAGILYPVVGLLASTFALNRQLLPLLFPLVAGLSILGPAVSAGFYELARRREEGIDANWWHFLDPLKGRSRLPLAMLTAVLAGFFLLWLGAAWLIYEATLGRDAPATIGIFFSRLFTTGEGWTMILLGNLVGGIFAIATLAVSVVSFPMVVDRPVDAGAAIATSLRAFSQNRSVMLGWGARVAGLLLLGALPAFIGLAVALPVLGYATWHLYTRAVQR